MDKVNRDLEKKMDEILDVGKSRNYTQEQYRIKLQEVIRDEYQDLKIGKRILNAAKDLRKIGGAK